MSTTTTTVKPTIYPYATPTGIIQLVPLEALEQAIQERDLARERGFETADVLTNTEKERDKAQAELAALRQSTRAVVAAVRPAIEAECLAQAVRRMEAVPVTEMWNIWGRTKSLTELRARLIAAAKGEGQDIKGLEGLTKERCLRIAEIEGDAAVAAGQPDVCPHAASKADEPSQAEAKPTHEELLAEAMKHPGVVDVERIYGGGHPWTPAVGNVEANPVRPNAAECGQCADKESEFEDFERAGATPKP